MTYATGTNSNPYTRKTIVTWHDFLSQGEIESVIFWAGLGYTWEINTVGFAARHKGELIEEMWEADFEAYTSEADLGTTEKPPRSEHLRHKYSSNLWKCLTAIRYHWLLHYSTNFPSWEKERKRRGIEKKV